MFGKNEQNYIFEKQIIYTTKYIGLHIFAWDSLIFPKMGKQKQANSVFKLIASQK